MVAGLKQKPNIVTKSSSYGDGDRVAEEKSYTEKEAHRKFAVDCFNLVWNLMEKKDRTKQDDDRMMHVAHASRFHWGEIGTPWNLKEVNGRYPECTLFSTCLKQHSIMLGDAWKSVKRTISEIGTSHLPTKQWQGHMPLLDRRRSAGTTLSWQIRLQSRSRRKETKTTY